MKVDKAQKLANIVVDYLKSQGELDALPEVIKTLEKKSVSLGLQGSAIVTTPVKLGGTELKAISSFIKSKYGKELGIVEKVDSSLIAGFTIHVGDEVIDSSLSTKLEKIRKELV